MKTLRKILFWSHLACGLTAGIFIFLMCLTGALLSFEKNIIGTAERIERRSNFVPGAKKLSPEEILRSAETAKPGITPSGISMDNNDASAAIVSFGREGQVFVDLYSGKVNGTGADGMRGFFGFVEDFHRWLALSGDARPVGKHINGAANVLFLFLAISGVYIWFPRKLKWKNFKPVILFRRGLRGKARNFNWHNVIGFWSSIVLVVLTSTAVVMSYKWANDLVYKATGNEPPAQQPRTAPEKPGAETVVPGNLNELWKAAESQSEWKTMTLRLPVEKEAVFTIEEGIYLNSMARSQLIVDPKTAAVSKWEPYGEQNSGRQLRSWIRFTHTGETGGIPGQFIGFLACIGGAVLVWTGFSLALRRFFSWRKREAQS